MPTFAYSAHGPSGIVTGTLSASDRGEAFSLLGKQRLQPFKLEVAGTAAKAAAPKAKAKPSETKADAAAALTGGPIKLKLPQVVLFVEELSGVKTLAAALRSKVRDGMSFSKAVAATSPSFGSLFCSLVSAGEASGSMDAILKRQALYMRSQMALRAKVMFALIYPAFLIFAALSVTVLFVVYLIPQLMELLNSTGGSLPAGAAIILKLSDLVKGYWWLIALIIATCTILFKSWAKRPESQIPYAKLRLRLPLFGSVLSARFYVQFLETLANLVGNGLPMIHAMQLTQQATDNAFLRTELDGVIRHVGEGVALSRALDRSGHFPPLLIDIVSVGEQTGKLAEALQKGAERFDRELAKRIDKLTALVQPAIICLMAGLVGIMAYMMITTIFQTISSIK
jgi:type II secretory pathway component PulF